jgi:hypothetical protein
MYQPIPVINPSCHSGGILWASGLTGNLRFLFSYLDDF